MEINQAEQLRLLVAALLRGGALGLLWEAFVALRILLGAYRPPERMRRQYKKRLPLLGRGVPFDKKTAIGRVGRGLITALFDLLFCLIFTVTVLLTLFGYGDGSLRLSVPVLALLGFGAVHAAAATVLSPIMAYFAYGLAAGLLYLAALLKLPLRPARALWRAVRRRRWRRISAALCAAQLTLADEGLAGEISNVKRKGSVRHGKKDAGQDHPAAVGDPHSHSHHLRGGHRHHRAQHHGGQPQPAGGRAEPGRGAGQ